MFEAPGHLPISYPWFTRKHRLTCIYQPTHIPWYLLFKFLLTSNISLVPPRTRDLPHLLFLRTASYQATLETLEAALFWDSRHLLLTSGSGNLDLPISELNPSHVIHTYQSESCILVLWLKPTNQKAAYSRVAQTNKPSVSTWNLILTSKLSLDSIYVATLSDWFGSVRLLNISSMIGWFVSRDRNTAFWLVWFCQVAVKQLSDWIALTHSLSGLFLTRDRVWEYRGW